MILFGGVTALDSGTKKAYHLGDTWEWTGGRWIQRFPAHSPTPRSGQTMVYDSNRGQIVMFGGRGDTGDLGDTWVYKDADWTELAVPNAPAGRILPGAAFDPLRDRVVLFGGTETSVDGKTITPAYDTWEFDGTTWTQIGGTGPSVTKPLLAYDAERNQVLMLGVDTSLNTLMYAYDAGSGTWNKLTPATLPACANEGVLAYQSSNQTVLYTGGVCATSTTTDTTYEWDGTTWNETTPVLSATRLFGAAMAIDDSRQLGVMFGGTPILGSPIALTWLYSSQSWITTADFSRPDPRSLCAFTTDPVNNTIWMYGGTDGLSSLTDFWQYQNGVWQEIAADNGPTNCTTPASAFDSERNKLVVSCAEGDVFEWDGAAWAHPTPKTIPTFHQFGTLAYDPNLKKTVLFGGYDNGSYLDQTWTWDGTTWTRQKKNPAPGRTLAAMWYDPTLKKIVIYGGIGRLTSTDRITRYDDMWTFDGTGWNQLKPASGTPGMRYGAQVTVDPRTSHLLLFGGIRVDAVPAVPPSTVPGQVQVYVDDMWDWDGSAWKQVQPTSVPPARENGRIAYDPTRDEIVLFGGYAGTFFSDVWIYNPTVWQARIFDPIGNRRRVGH
jgi:Kelch motif